MNDETLATLQSRGTGDYSHTKKARPVKVTFRTEERMKAVIVQGNETCETSEKKERKTRKEIVWGIST